MCRLRWFRKWMGFGRGEWKENVFSPSENVHFASGECLCFSPGKVWSTFHSLRWAGDIPAVQKLQEGEDKLQQPWGSSTSTDRAARDRVQWEEAEALLCTGTVEHRDLVPLSLFSLFLICPWASFGINIWNHLNLVVLHWAVPEF